MKTLLVVLVIALALVVNRADPFTTATFVSSGIGLSIGSVIALACANGSKARRSFHI
jgi:hypothetical protein